MADGPMSPCRKEALSLGAFIGQGDRPISALQLYTPYGQGYYTLCARTGLLQLGRYLPCFQDRGRARDAERHLGHIVWNDQGHLSGLQDVANGFKRAISCIVRQEDRSTRGGSIRRQGCQKAWMSIAMVDGTLPMLIDGTEKAEHLFGKKRAYVLGQAPLGGRQGEELPVVHERVCHRSCQASNAGPDVFGTMEERLADLDTYPQRCKRLGRLSGGACVLSTKEELLEQLPDRMMG